MNLTVKKNLSTLVALFQRDNVPSLSQLCHYFYDNCSVEFYYLVPPIQTIKSKIHLATLTLIPFLFYKQEVPIRKLLPNNRPTRLHYSPNTTFIFSSGLGPIYPT